MEMKLLHEMWKERDYISLGFDSFRDFFEAPINSGGLDISRGWAIELIKTYEKYVIQLGVSEDRLLDIPVRKLYFLKEEATAENIEDVLSRAKNMTLKGLELDRRNIDITNCQHIRTKQFCNDCEQFI